VPPEEYFVAEKCLKFQTRHMTVPDIQPQNTHPPDVAEKAVTAVPNATVMETPELYANPALGCAQASSTPDPGKGQGMCVFVCVCVCLFVCMCVFV